MAYGTSDMDLFIAVRVAALKTHTQLKAHTQWTYPEQNIKQEKEIFQTYRSTGVLSLIPCLHSEKTKKGSIYTWQKGIMANHTGPSTRLQTESAEQSTV